MTRHSLRALLITAVTTLLVSACGGSVGPSVPTGATDPGTLKALPRTVVELRSEDIDAAADASGLRGLAGRARCDVRIVALEYNTVGVGGEAADASGVLLVPAGRCAQETPPLLAYARATSVEKNKTLADASQAETLLLTAFFASQGYAVVASDYLGYARSTYPYHPYLHADSEASTVVDAIRAARAAAPGQSLRLSGQVMLTGYSQGGHASAAAQRLIEATLSSEIDIVANAHMAGPYNISGALRDPTPVYSYQIFAPFLITSWKKIYGNLYGSASEVFRAPFAANIDNLLPSATLTSETLVSSGALPGGTPAQVREALMQPGFLADVQNNDGNALYRASRRNDVLGWSPQARTLLCGGSGDPTVPYAVHQAVALADFARRGVTSVSVTDVDADIRSTFGPAGSAPTDPSSRDYVDYFSNYHGVFQPLFCFARTKAFFDPAQ